MWVLPSSLWLLDPNQTEPASLCGLYRVSVKRPVFCVLGGGGQGRGGFCARGLVTRVTVELPSALGAVPGPLAAGRAVLRV